MSLHRLTSVTLGVPSVDATSTFFRAFGLTDVGGGRLATRDGGEQVKLVPASRRSLHRLGVGVHDGDDVGRIAVRLQRWHDGLDLRVDADPDGQPRLEVREPVTGVVVEVSVAPKLAGGGGAPAAVNRPGAAVERVDRPADAVLADTAVAVSNLTHLAVGTPDQPATLAFFRDGLGFEISDEVPGIIAFTRCGEVHHHLALQAAPVTFVHHVAFEVDSVDDVVRGGSAMVEADPDHHLWGVGRHAIGSNWFWYLREPGGTFVEYTADIDRITANDRYVPKQWAGREFIYSFGPAIPAEFLEPRDMADLIAGS